MDLLGMTHSYLKIVDFVLKPSSLKSVLSAIAIRIIAARAIVIVSRTTCHVTPLVANALTAQTLKPTSF
jgi:hypothetical protein